MSMQRRPAAAAAQPPPRRAPPPQTAAQRTDPWSLPANAEYRRELYKNYLKWLTAGTGPKVRISHVFTWSGGSWDVLGTHYASTTPEGSFRDEIIYNWVAAHNAKVNGEV